MKDLPYTVITKKLGYEAEKWCKDNLGERYFPIGRKSGTWTCFWASDINSKSYRWHFKSEQDAFWFSLKWQ
jgi:hypothetical protein